MDQTKNLGVRECYVPLVDVMKEHNQSTPRSSQLLTNMRESNPKESERMGNKRTEDTAIPGKRTLNSSKKQTNKCQVEDFITNDEWESDRSDHLDSDWEVEQNRYKKAQHMFRNGSKSGSDWGSHKKHTEISDYEKMILQNRNKKLALLKSLNLEEVKENYCKAVQALKPPRKISTKRIYCAIPTVLTRSRRLAQLSTGTAETFLFMTSSDLALKKNIFPGRIFSHTLPKYHREVQDLKPKSADNASSHQKKEASAINSSMFLPSVDKTKGTCVTCYIRSLCKQSRTVVKAQGNLPDLGSKKDKS